MNRMLLSVLFVYALHVIPAARAEEGAKLRRAVIAVDQDTKPTNKFSAKEPQLVVFFIGDGVKKGQKVRGVWIADDVGAAAPKNTKIIEDSLVATEDKQSSAFKLSRPTKGWPVGKYHVDLYVEDKLAEAVNFEIEAAE
jgi:hypothetical protein